MANKAVEAAVRMAFDGNDLGVQYFYAEWEAAFISRWSLAILENGKYSQGYMEVENINPAQVMDFLTAARIFHTNKFRFQSGEQLVQFENDYDMVEPVLVEEPLTDDDWERVEVQHDAFDPRKKPQVFDMKAHDDQADK
jgi:hypothetical protein|tara:strand:+ start:1037 stop:1453 length:417 start_codon:yes stop_codon:yes gene_type:complete